MMIKLCRLIFASLLCSVVVKSSNWIPINETFSGWTEGEIPSPFKYPLDSYDEVLGRVTSTDPSLSPNSTVRLKWDFVEHDSTDYVIFSVSTDALVDTWKEMSLFVSVSVSNTDKSKVDLFYVKFAVYTDNTTHLNHFGAHDMYVNRTMYSGPVLSYPIRSPLYAPDAAAGGSDNIDFVMYRFNERILEAIFARPMDAVDDQELDLTLDPDVGYLVHASEYEWISAFSYGRVQRNITWWDDEPDNRKEFVGASTIVTLVALLTSVFG